MNSGTNLRAFGLRGQGFLGRSFRFKAIAISFLALSSQLTFIESAEAATIDRSVSCSASPRTGAGNVTMRVGDILLINQTGCKSGGFGSGGTSYGTWKSGPTTGQEIGEVDATPLPPTGPRGTRVSSPGSGRVSFSTGDEVTFLATTATPGVGTIGITFSTSEINPDADVTLQILITVLAAPDAPTLNSVTAGDRRVTVAFTAGANNGAAITDYEYSLNGGTYTSAGTTTSPFTITGLSGRTSYSVTLKARNSVGLSAASNSISATTSDAALDASETAAETARVAAAAETARVAAAAQAARLAREQQELINILALIPKLGELTLSLGETTKSLYSTKCVKGKTIKNVKKGAKCPKGFVKR